MIPLFSAAPAFDGSWKTPVVRAGIRTGEKVSSYRDTATGIYQISIAFSKKVRFIFASILKNGALC